MWSFSDEILEHSHKIFQKLEVNFIRFHHGGKLLEILQTHIKHRIILNQMTSIKN